MLPVLVLLHDRLAVAAALYLLALGLWGFVGGLRRAEVSPSYRGALVIGEGLLGAQVLLGVLLVLLGHRPAEWVHFLYGILVP
ncbi:MAG: hypothetical protein IRY97_01475, partial [Thermomicrobiaceae bacterium]|nr:hypothetical protein [Thermomicrobiaceae bacterium]